MGKLNNRPNRKLSRCYLQDKIVDHSRDGSLASRTDFHDDGQAAGIATWRRIVKENVPQRSGVTKSKSVDFSLLQPGNGLKPDPKMRLDPGKFGVAAGAMVKPTPIEIWQETGIVGNLKPEERTDPITHFKHEKMSFDKRQVIIKRGKRRPDGEHRAAKQSWTWSRDKGVREQMNLHDCESAGIKRFVIDQTGQWVYCIHGVEDLRPAATRTYLKCEKYPKKDHIKFNDKVAMPCCVRDNVPGKEDCLKPPNNWTKSDRIWDVLTDEAYQKVLRGESPEPGQAAVFMRMTKQQNKEQKEREKLKQMYEQGMISEPELMKAYRQMEARQDDRNQRARAEEKNDRKARSSYSLPPDRFVGQESGDRNGQSTRRGSGNGEIAFAPQAADRTASLAGSQTAREPSSRKSPMMQDPWAGTRPDTAPPARPAPVWRARSTTSSRSEASLSMTQVSITNSFVPNRRDSKSKNSDCR